MKVILPGKKDSKVKRFTCVGCGCVFEAEEWEYTSPNYTEWAYDRITAKCRCPYCGKMVYSQEK